MKRFFVNSFTTLFVVMSFCFLISSVFAKPIPIKNKKTLRPVARKATVPSTNTVMPLGVGKSTDVTTPAIVPTTTTVKVELGSTTTKNVGQPNRMWRQETAKLFDLYIKPLNIEVGLLGSVYNSDKISSEKPISELELNSTSSPNQIDFILQIRPFGPIRTKINSISWFVKRFAIEYRIPLQSNKIETEAKYFGSALGSYSIEKSNAIIAKLYAFENEKWALTVGGGMEEIKTSGSISMGGVPISTLSGGGRVPLIQIGGCYYVNRWLALHCTLEKPFSKVTMQAQDIDGQSLAEQTVTYGPTLYVGVTFKFRGFFQQEK